MGYQPESKAGISPARWAASGFLGGAAIMGMAWAIIGRAPTPPTRAHTPVVTVDLPSARSADFDPVAPGSYPALPARASSAEPGAATPVRIGASTPRGPTTTGPAPTGPAPTDADHAIADRITDPITVPSTDADPPPRAVPLRVNINTASLAELELLPRIGPTLAQRIIEFRDQQGTINSLKRLQDVKGIGERTAARLEPYIRFD